MAVTSPLAKGICQLRTRVTRPKLRLVDTTADTIGGRVDTYACADPVAAETLLAQALPAEAHAALDTQYYRRQIEQRHVAANADRLRYAVVDLAAIDLPPSQLIDALSPSFDEPIVRERLEQALDCLTRIAAEWRRRSAQNG
jgi:hypothetical protein